MNNRPNRLLLLPRQRLWRPSIPIVAAALQADIIAIVGERDGEPIYDLTALGRAIEEATREQSPPTAA